MAQIKVYGLKDHLNPIKRILSDVIHRCVMEAFAYPAEKRFHRFFPMEEEDMIVAPGRTKAYTIIECSIFEGRSIEAKKALIRLLYAQIEDELGIQPMDVEITIFETPRHHWGIHGLPGDEVGLNYRVDV